jgi:uncharacterized membrane protein YkvI
VKQNLKLAFVFVGTIVGAGLASGQEIMQFFTLYGLKGYLGLFLCGFFYISLSIVVINLCFKYKFKSYKDIVIYSLGNKFGTVVDFFLTLFLFGGNTIMLSGGGAMLHEYLNIGYSWGIFIMAVLSYLVAVFSTKGVITINSAIVPLSTAAILILGAAVILTNDFSSGIAYSILHAPQMKRGWFTSSILYSSFNLMVATGVICPMLSETNDKKSFLKGCLIGSIILTIIAVIINSSIIIYSPKSLYTEIPNLYIAKQFGWIMPLFLTIIIWLEMFSTEISNLYSLSKRLQQSSKLSYSSSLLLIIIISIPVSFIGFSSLIRLLYPPFGAVSLIFIIGCLIKAFRPKRYKGKH